MGYGIRLSAPKPAVHATASAVKHSIFGCSAIRTRRKKKKKTKLAGSVDGKMVVIDS